MENARELARQLTLKQEDRFADIREAIERHREEHGCHVATMSALDGRALSVLTRATHSSYVLAIGGGLGYAALDIVESFGRTGRLDVVEDDETHARLVREAFARYALSERLRVHSGSPREVLTALSGPYDLAVVNGGWEAASDIYEDLVRVTRTGGSLLFRTGAAHGEDETRAMRRVAERVAGDPRLAAWFEQEMRFVLAARIR